MNSNRTRYASTPTYGMQKRGFMKKPAPARPVSEAPDFSKAPDPLNGMPLQQQPAFTQPVPPPQQPVYMPTAQPFFGSRPSTAPIQSMPTAQVPFATPSFMQPGSQLPPMQSMMPQPMAQPLGNTVPPVQSTPAFSGRSQGFVPPAPTQPVSQPMVQPAAPVQQMPFAPIPQQTVQPFGGMPSQPPVNPLQQPYGYQPVSQPNAGFGQMPPQQAQPFSVQSAAPKAPREPLDAGKLWTIFLFGLLPLLFIPCLFVSGAWSAIRYVFIAATVVGLGAMWYRQMYTPTIRLIVSMVYVALCIGAIAMLMQGTTDVQQTSASMRQNVASQQQSSPDAANIVITEQTPEPEATPTPPPVSGPSAAERRLELFMNLWMVNNTTEMVQLVQPSWCSAQENASMALFMVLANRTPEDFVIEEISGTETDNSRTITMRATINKNTGKAPSVYRFMIMMVKEGDEWYVNPNSLATNDQQAASTDENVVKTQSSGSVTEPPRTTVTPAPPASTTLYYNVGGNNYHMDPNCPSVNADNLPFDMSFSYGDLKEVKSANNLLPCLRCDAPTNALE